VGRPVLVARARRRRRAPGLSTASARPRAGAARAREASHLGRRDPRAAGARGGVRARGSSQGRAGRRVGAGGSSQWTAWRTGPRTRVPAAFAVCDGACWPQSQPPSLGRRWIWTSSGIPRSVYTTAAKEGLILACDLEQVPEAAGVYAFCRVFGEKFEPIY